jgi:hypothetical protein
MVCDRVAGDTFPHDYRVIADSEVRPTIGGRQVVNFWAIAFLEEGDFAASSTKYGCADLANVHALRVRSCPE